MNKKFWSNFLLIFSIVLFSLIAFFALNIVGMQKGISSVQVSLPKKLKYRTYFGHCPSRVAGKLALKLVKSFEKNRSLHDVKKLIIKKNVVEEHFLSDYRIQYDPLKKFLKISFDCPKPLMKVQVYKNNGQESYEAILVENGQLYDPTYEVLLKEEHKLNGDLPFLALPVREMDGKFQFYIADLVRKMDLKFRRKLSEIILSDAGELTVILSIDGHPSSVFMGADLWEEKMVKLQKIVKYVGDQMKVPAIINLTNLKKIVVKFSDNS